MTNPKENLVVAKRLWQAGKFFEPGTPLATVQAESDARNAKLDIDHMTKYGFLADQKELERQRNPEAFTARQEAASKDQQIAELTRQLEEARASTSDPGVAEALAAAQRQSAEWQRLANENGAKVTSLTQESANWQKLAEDAQTTLAEYREYVGELLPDGYPDRKLLLELGYLTTLHIEQTDDATLEGEKGLGEKKVEAIRKVTPYKPAEE